MLPPPTSPAPGGSAQAPADAPPEGAQHRSLGKTSTGGKAAPLGAGQGRYRPAARGYSAAWAPPGRLRAKAHLLGAPSPSVAKASCFRGQCLNPGAGGDALPPLSNRDQLKPESRTVNILSRPSVGTNDASTGRSIVTLSGNLAKFLASAVFCGHEFHRLTTPCGKSIGLEFPTLQPPSVPCSVLEREQKHPIAAAPFVTRHPAITSPVRDDPPLGCHVLFSGRLSMGGLCTPGSTSP